MRARKELQDVLRALQREGAVLSKGRSGHIKVRNPETGRSINIASTPCNYRSVLNSVARLRRIGFLQTWQRGTSRTPRREYDPVH